MRQNILAGGIDTGSTSAITPYGATTWYDFTLVIPAKDRACGRCFVPARRGSIARRKDGVFMGLAAFPRKLYAPTAAPVRSVARPIHNIFILTRGHSVVDPARGISVPIPTRCVVDPARGISIPIPIRTRCVVGPIRVDLPTDAVGQMGALKDAILHCQSGSAHGSRVWSLTPRPQEGLHGASGAGTVPVNAGTVNVIDPALDHTGTVLLNVGASRRGLQGTGLEPCGQVIGVAGLAGKLLGKTGRDLYAATTGSNRAGAAHGP